MGHFFALLDPDLDYGYGSTDLIESRSLGCTSWLPVSGAASAPEAVAAGRGGGAGWAARAVLVGYLYLGLHLCLKLWQLGGVEGLGGQLGLYRQAGDGRNHRQRVEPRRTLN